MTESKAEMIRRTHEIFCGLIGKEVKLLTSDPPGRTDCTSFIAIPIEDPEAELVLKHEWQHWFFHTKLHARAMFVDKYVETLLPPSVPPSWIGDLKAFLHMFINGLDDLRVCSLWELIYPQSAEDIQDRWRKIMRAEARYKQDVVMYAMALGLGMDHAPKISPSDPLWLQASMWEPHHDLIQQGALKVLRRGFPACLVVTRQIMDVIAGDILSLLQPPPPPAPNQTGGGAPNSGQNSPPVPTNDPGQGGDSKDPAPAGKAPARRLAAPALHNAAREKGKEQREENNRKAMEKRLDNLQNMVNSSKKTFEKKKGQESWQFNDTDASPGPDPDFMATKALVQAVLKVTGDDQINLLLQKSDTEVKNVVANLQSTYKKLTPSQHLLKGMPPGVRFDDISRKETESQSLTSEDQRAVRTLRMMFTRLMDRKKIEMHDSGSMLDPMAYMDLLNGSGDPEIFEDEESSKGFSALVLIDMSGSMRSRWSVVARACKILAKSLKFPFSRFKVWGFSGDSAGGVHILRFTDPEHGYSGRGVDAKAWGLTPLHLATQVAIRGVMQMPGEVQHLFIISDGVPTHMEVRRGLIHNASSLVEEVGRLIQEGRMKGVHITGLVIGNGVTDRDAGLMFGPSLLWKRVKDGEDEVLKVLVSMVRESFAFYLKGQ